MQSSYITSAQKAQQLPELGGPEIAFVGRSNCGKSSLLNALLERRNLARASNTPGRTQMVNFFAVDRRQGRLILADLPGYGFSAIGKDVRMHWQELVGAYLKRPALQHALFLLDVRRIGNLQEAGEDQDLLFSLLRSRVPVTVVLTKADKIAAAAVKKAVAEAARYIAAEGLGPARIISVSVLKKRGIAELQTELGIKDIDAGPTEATGETT